MVSALSTKSQVLEDFEKDKKLEEVYEKMDKISKDYRELRISCKEIAKDQQEIAKLLEESDKRLEECESEVEECDRQVEELKRIPDQNPQCLEVLEQSMVSDRRDLEALVASNMEQTEEIKGLTKRIGLLEN
jgi:archaellum component FlaC